MRRLTKDVIDVFRKQGLNAKVTLLETLHELYTTYYRLGDLADSYYGPLAPTTGLYVISICAHIRTGSCCSRIAGKPQTR